jgi:hypothetical protein
MNPILKPEINKMLLFFLFVYFLNCLTFVLCFEFHWYRSFGFIKCERLLSCYYKNFDVSHVSFALKSLIIHAIYSYAFFYFKWDVKLTGEKRKTYRLLVFATSALFNYFVIEIDFILGRISSALGEILIVINCVTLCASGLFLCLWPRLKWLSRKMILNGDFFLVTLTISTLLFCTFTVSYEINDMNRITGYGFPIVWHIKEEYSITRDFIWITVNNLIFDFLVYFLAVGVLFWMLLFLRGQTIFLIQRNKMLVSSLIVITSLFLLLFVRNIDQGHTTTHIRYRPILKTFTIHLGPTYEGRKP